ncbi:MAG TPA: ATP-dependent helicase, partial [Bacteroidales bacterium]|nr:ATP-dependent helicase [Bacteroidales bacterium]
MRQDLEENNNDNNEEGKEKPALYRRDAEDELPAFLIEKEDLLNSFLSNIVISKTPQKPVAPEEYNDLQKISSDVYAALAIPTYMEGKLAQLRKITDAIEKKSFDVNVLASLDFSKLKINYPKSLNRAQLAGVVLTEKPVLCIAGAGSGKTRVIVHRVAYLIEKGVDPQAILLLTFTRKAANEMLHRVETLLKDKSVSKVTGGTFHSFASFVLRKYGNMLQLPTNFTIIDNGDSEDIIDLIRSELKFNSKDKRFPKKGRILDIISYSRNKKSTIAEIIKKQYSGLEDYIPAIELIYSGYSRYKKISQILDFDDLMEVLNESLKNNQRFREAIQNAYQYVMVDEFQDTNAVQNEIVNLIAQKHKRLMVVGDDSQSIYAFRGADYENILRFPEVYPDCLVIKIEENYRSNQHILDFTNSIMENAYVGYKKKLFTTNKNKHLPVIKRTYNQEDEAVFIVDRIAELNEQGISLDELAVLNRADWHNRYIQAELNKRGIPYIVIGGFKFNERMHVRDVVAYLRLTFNPVDAVSWHRVLKYVGGIGQVTASGLIASLQRSAGSGNFEFEAFKQRKFYEELLLLG